MKITFTSYSRTYTVETEHDDYGAEEIKEMFSRLLVQAGFSPEVIENSDGTTYKCEVIENEEA